MSAEWNEGEQGSVRILSDLHLAHPASQIARVESLRPLIAGARAVIFNGDTCEQISRDWREEGETKLSELKTLCEEEGASALFIAGNHDPQISDCGWLNLAGGRIFITHGHALCLGVAPWSPEYLGRKKEILQMVAEREKADEDLAYRWETTQLISRALIPRRTRRMGKKGRNYVLSAFWPPERFYNIMRVWRNMVDTAEEFVERFCPATGVLLFGHFHRSGAWPCEARTICNTGAFMRGARPMVGELSDGWFRLLSVEKEGETFQLGAARATIRL